MAKFVAGTTIAGTALTDSYQTLLSAPASPFGELLILNDCDKAVVCKVGESEVRVPAALSLRLGALAANYSLQVAVLVKHDGEVPTAGKIQAVALSDG